jgi:hypothetical protein
LKGAARCSVAELSRLISEVAGSAPKSVMIFPSKMSL